jgi:hypothetical protein
MGVEGTLTLMPASLDLVCIDGGELGAHAVDPEMGRTVTVGDGFHYRRFGRALSGAYKVVPCSGFSSWTCHDRRLLQITTVGAAGEPARRRLPAHPTMFTCSCRVCTTTVNGVLHFLTGHPFTTTCRSHAVCLDLESEEWKATIETPATEWPRRSSFRLTAPCRARRRTALPSRVAREGTGERPPPRGPGGPLLCRSFSPVLRAPPASCRRVMPASTAVGRLRAFPIPVPMAQEPYPAASLHRRAARGRRAAAGAEPRRAHRRAASPGRERGSREGGRKQRRRHGAERRGGGGGGGCPGRGCTCSCFSILGMRGSTPSLGSRGSS